MAKFQGSGFMVDLPEPAFDSSSYAFAFPDAGDLAPAITIRFDIVKDKPDLKTYADQQREVLKQSFANLETVSEVHNKRGTWDYAVCVIEWGEPDCRMRQKQLYVFVPGQTNRLFTLVGTDLADNFSSSEKYFDQVIRTFEPNDIQVLI